MLMQLVGLKLSLHYKYCHLSFGFSSFLRQALHNENVSLKAEIQNLQAQISDQVRDLPFIH